MEGKASDAGIRPGRIRKGILVGAPKLKALSTQQVGSISCALAQEGYSTDIEIVGCFTRSLFIPDHGFGGTLYEHGHKILTSDEKILYIQQVYTVMVSETTYPFVEGTVYTPPIPNAYYHLPVVHETTTTIAIPTSQILRKVILYPADNASFAVLDLLRPNLPISSKDVIVPCFVEANDIVVVQGTDEEWVGYVRTTNTSAKTAQVRFLKRIAEGYAHGTRKNVLQGRWVGRCFHLVAPM